MVDGVVVFVLDLPERETVAMDIQCRICPLRWMCSMLIESDGHRRSPNSSSWSHPFVFVHFIVLLVLVFSCFHWTDRQTDRHKDCSAFKWLIGNVGTWKDRWQERLVFQRALSGAYLAVGAVVDLIDAARCTEQHVEESGQHWRPVESALHRLFHKTKAEMSFFF